LIEQYLIGVHCKANCQRQESTFCCPHRFQPAFLSAKPQKVDAMRHPLLTPTLAALIAGLGALLLVALAMGCHGRSDSRPPFSLTVAPGALSIPAGGGGFVTITLSRTRGFTESVALSLEGAPAGVVGSGSIPVSNRTGQFALLVDRGVAPQTIEALRVKATAPGLAQTTTFKLVVTAPLPVGEITPDQVQASGNLQRAGTLENTPIILEPASASAAKDASGNTEVRHGFRPVGGVN
jgi:hypothetical protein